MLTAIEAILVRLLYLCIGFIIALFLSAKCNADYPSLFTEPFKLQEVYVNYRSFMPNGNSPFMTDGSELGKEVNLHVNTDFMRYFYLNNKVWSLTDQHQFRWIGYNPKLGIRVLPMLDLEYEHFSKHILDKNYPYRASGNAFPVEDSIGFNLYFYRDQSKPSLADIFR